MSCSLWLSLIFNFSDYIFKWQQFVAARFVRLRALIGNTFEVYIWSVNQYQIFIRSNIPAIAHLCHYRYKGAIFNWLILPGKNKASTIYCGSFFGSKLKIYWDNQSFQNQWDYCRYQMDTCNLSYFYEYCQIGVPENTAVEK